ncbi:transcriptional regulator PdhR [Endozoicomonas sp. OPT23]|uniref:FCD domain-containing protein n=1 Tax=Endozoicomonas sp. OPT23 TaxID=2072845 RepID=UPI00129A4440|nr:FCD domain-containing protein [Endozoicomonas sp. OPT23]MRI31587.1 transcriptional regulator PdhR [Endozoicomonas sp. OPT23]
MKQQTLAERITEKLETLIVEGVFRPGDRLPAERQLSEQLGVSRPSLRSALQSLAVKGIIRSRQGGGHFVTEALTSSLTDPLLDLLGKHPEARDDVLEFRFLLEGASASYAAQRATEQDCDNLKQAFAELEQAMEKNDRERESKADLDFHLAIAEASHNMVLLHSMRSMFSMLKHNIYTNIGGLYDRNVTGEDLRLQHKAILEAILAGNSVDAKEAAEQHILYVQQALSKLEQQQKRNQRAKSRKGELEPV